MRTIAGIFYSKLGFACLKSLSSLFFSILDEKLSHSWIQIQKKQFNFLRLSMGFDRKKIKI